MPAVSHCRRGTATAAAPRSSVETVGRLSTISEAPAPTIPTATPIMAMSLPRPVTAATARAGPTMYDTSTAIESSANAVRRWSAGTMAARYWRMSPKIGRLSTPATNPSPTNASNPRLGAASQ